MAPLPPGEIRLLRAILFDAIRIVTNPRHPRLRREVWEWMHDDDATDVFAFITICETLGLDPSAVRSAVTRPVLRAA